MHSEDKNIAVHVVGHTDMLNCCANDTNYRVFEHIIPTNVLYVSLVNTSIAKSYQVRTHSNNCFQYISQVPLEQIKD